MPESRDPRLDPRPGDWTVTRPTKRAHGGTTWYWLVIGRDGDRITYKDDRGDTATTTLVDWIEGSTDDEVLNVAE